MRTTLAMYLSDNIAMKRVGWPHAGLMPLPPMSLARAGQDFLPFLKAGSAVLARTTLLLGTKTIATAVATRCAALAGSVGNNSLYMF